MPRCTTSAAAVLLLLTSATAQDRIADIDAIFGFVTATNPGCVVGIARRGEVVATRAYGLADVDRAVPLTPDTKFDIGSVHKQFVAASVLLLAEDGALALSDDVREHLPELPDVGHTIRIDHLLTHTSGVRDWSVLLPLAEEGTDALALILRQRGLDFAPGERWSYSNSGYVLLKEIVARTAGTTFGEFVGRRIFEPLGMKSTEYVVDILHGTGERAIGYEKEGAGWKPFLRLGNQRGGGGVISTANDLLLWNEALTNQRLGAFVGSKLEERATLNNGRRLSYARGLIVDDGPSGRLVAHSGGAAGYSTWLGRFRDHGLSVVVLGNFEPLSATSLAGKVADLFLPALPPDEPALEGKIDGRAGLYLAAGTHEPLRLTAQDGRLAIASGPPLVPIADDRFRPARPSLYFRSEDAFELTFVSADEFELKSMEGDVARYRRAEPIAPTAAELAAFAGRYASEDLGVVCQVAPDARGLVLRLEHAPYKTIVVEPAAPDTFLLRLIAVQFRRDADGQPIGFDYSRPGLRRLPFTRIVGPESTAK